MRSAFGVDHGEISKLDTTTPFPGARWGPNATPEAKQKQRKRFTAGVGLAGTGGAAIGGVFGGKPGLKSKQGKVGAALAAGGGALAVGGNYRDKKRGVILTGRQKAGS
jgi:hypothetical protein